MSSDIVVIIGAILGFLGQAIKQYYTNKNSQNTVNKKIEESGATILKQLEKSDANQTLRLNEIEKNNKKVKTMMELRVFEKTFVRDFKTSSNKFVEKMNVEDNLTTFLKGGVSEIAHIFRIIIEQQFKMSDHSIEDEILLSKVSLCSKFKAKFKANGKELSIYKNIIEAELLTFIEFYQAVKILENGDRMEKFGNLCKKTTINIITKIAKL